MTGGSAHLRAVSRELKPLPFSPCGSDRCDRRPEPVTSSTTSVSTGQPGGRACLCVWRGLFSTAERRTPPRRSDRTSAGRNGLQETAGLAELRPARIAQPVGLSACAAYGGQAERRSSHVTHCSVQMSAETRTPCSACDRRGSVSVIGD